MILDSTGFWDRVREALGLRTAPDIARKLGLSKQSVYDWSKGKWPSLDTLARISESGNVSLHWLVTGRGSKTVAVDGPDYISISEMQRFLLEQALVAGRVNDALLSKAQEMAGQKGRAESSDERGEKKRMKG